MHGARRSNENNAKDQRTVMRFISKSNLHRFGIAPKLTREANNL